MKNARSLVAVHTRGSLVELNRTEKGRDTFICDIQMTDY